MTLVDALIPSDWLKRSTPLLGEGRVRGALSESEPVERPPHSAPFPASGEREQPLHFARSALKEPSLNGGAHGQSSDSGNAAIEFRLGGAHGMRREGRALRSCAGAPAQP